ncbi:MAG: hypothetical protein ACE5PV_05565 [Candidatus Poribacteria bacterium]
MSPQRLGLSAKLVDMNMKCAYCRAFTVMGKEAPAVRRGEELPIVGNAQFEILFWCGV